MVAVGVVAGEAAELVAGQLGGLSAYSLCCRTAYGLM